MMKKIILSLILLLLVFTAGNVFAQSGTITSPFAFLETPIGTSNIAMGGTYVAIADSAETMFLNPGGLVKLNFPYISFYGDISGLIFNGNFDGYIAFVLPPLNEKSIFGGLGVGAIANIVYDNVIEYDASGNPTGRKVINYNIASYLTFAFKQSLIDKDGGIGFSVKFVASGMDDVTGYAFGLDIGAVAKIAMFSFGLVLKDLPTIGWYSNRNYVEFATPRVILGVAYKNISLETNKTTLAISIEIDKALTDESFDFSIGCMFLVWTYKPKVDTNSAIDDIISDINNSNKNKFGTNLYILAGYDFKTLSLGLTFTLDPINMKLDIATKFPTSQDGTFGLYTTLEFHF